MAYEMRGEDGPEPAIKDEFAQAMYRVEQQATHASEVMASIYAGIRYAQERYPQRRWWQLWKRRALVHH